jgi:hypothetical protein
VKLEPIARIRRNHALEHATVHILTRRHPGRMVVGRSDWAGFSIHSQIETEDVEQAAREALDRLQAGQHGLAIHPNCGTGLAITGLLTGLAAFLTLWLGRSDRKFRWMLLPEMLLASLAAASLAQPLGLMAQQRLTTSTELLDTRINRVYRVLGGPVSVIRVETG